MKQRIGTVIETDLLRRARRQAADEGRPFNELIQDALDQYLTSKMPAPHQPAPHRREAAYRLFCEQPMGILPEQFREILRADAWNL